MTNENKGIDIRKLELHPLEELYRRRRSHGNRVSAPRG